MISFRPCPFSLTQDERGEAHPHDMGCYYRLGRRLCAVCERPVPERCDTPEEARYRAEARAELHRITGQVYWENRT
jgi:hypothetical protein